MERMTPTDALHAAPHTAENTVLLNSINHVGRTRWSEPTGVRGEKRRDCPLIHPDQRNHEALHDGVCADARIDPTSLEISRCTSANRIAVTGESCGGLKTNIIVAERWRRRRLSANGRSSLQYASRISRFIRFLFTAFPAFFGTANPTVRHCPSPAFRTNMHRTCTACVRRPRANTASKAPRPRNVWLSATQKLSTQLEIHAFDCRPAAKPVHRV